MIQCENSLTQTSADVEVNPQPPADRDDKRKTDNEMRGFFFRSLALTSAWSLFHSVAVAQAPSRDPAGAEKLFAEARKLLDAGKYAEACQKLADSHQLDPAIGTLLNLAQCYTKMGKTATAWATYREAADAARAAGQSDREKKAARAAEALEADLAKCNITVPEAAAAKGVEVKRNGMLVPRSLWGTSEPVDPGEYVVEARTPSGKPWSTRVKVEPGRVAVIVLPPFEEPQGSTDPARTSPPETSAAATNGLGVGTDVDRQGSNPTRRIAELGLLGLGVAGLALGTVEILRFTSKNDEISKTCTGTRCPTSQEHEAYLTLHDEATTARTMSWIGFGVGSASLVTGALLFLTETSSPRVASPTRFIAPMLRADGGGVTWGGGW